MIHIKTIIQSVVIFSLHFTVNTGLYFFIARVLLREHLIIHHGTLKRISLFDRTIVNFWTIVQSRFHPRHAYFLFCFIWWSSRHFAHNMYTAESLDSRGHPRGSPSFKRHQINHCILDKIRPLKRFCQRNEFVKKHCTIWQYYLSNWYHSPSVQSNLFSNEYLFLTRKKNNSN